LAPWIDIVKMLGSPARIAAVPLPLMDVAVDDHDPADPALGLHHAGRDRAVVEHAITLAAPGEGVVGAAGEVDREAVDERGPTGRDGRAGRAQRALEQRRAPREAELALLLGVEGAGVQTRSR
jgi:hypothetical protein